MLFRRFEFDVSEVDYKRDMKLTRDCFLAESSARNRGVRVRVVRRNER